MPQTRQHLPIDPILPQLVDALTGARATVLRAATGAGKTTRVPPAVLDADPGGRLAQGRRIVMLEPRRIAARAAARRIAQERGSQLGGEVGYQVRFDRRASDGTRILVVTEGVLLAMLQRDPFLEDIGVVIFDEFHERNLQSDLALAMVRRVQKDVREDLAIVVMSATLDPEPIAAFLGDCPTLVSQGRSHPVSVSYLERPDSRPMPAIVATGVRRMLGATGGDILAFLPGVGEIRRTAGLLESLEGVRVLSLYGDLPADQQDAVLLPGDQRRVVLATNVAETSVTIEGITAVVDSGLVRELRFDPGSGLDRLQLGRISRDSAEQRAGRAGRLGPGHCLRLWTEHDERSLAAHKTPEIARVDLAAPVLQLLAWGESEPQSFPWFEAPGNATLERARQLLLDLGAADSRGATALGRAMVRLPVHPRLARLLVAGRQFGQARRAARAAALLSEREIAHTSGLPVAHTAGPCDVVDRVEALDDFEASGYGETAIGPVQRGRAKHVLRVSSQLARLVRGLPRIEPETAGSTAEGAEDELLRQALLCAYPDRVAKRREPGERRGLMVGGRGIELSEASCVDGELFLCLDLDSRKQEAQVRRASTIAPSWLPTDQLTNSFEVFFDPEGERVRGRRRRRYRDLVLAEEDVDPQLAPNGAAEIERCLVTAALERPERALALDKPEVAGFLARLRSLVRWRPELGLPSFEGAELEAQLHHLAVGKRSFEALRRAPLLEVLAGSLSFEQRRALDQMAPERIEVPSGSRIRLAYEPGKAPVLAVKIQEVFGLQTTPSVAGGRVPVLMHLLAPNMRPQQVTDDLPSFWRNTYAEVRKELKGRYPKHSWPEDPLTARPEKRPQRRRS
ncbi:MAG: ATP-dependent helicase HrpB [Acidobacteriota bacterium]